MKIKYKKKINENAHIKLTIKVDDYQLLDKMSKNEMTEVVNILKSLMEGNKKC